MSPRLNMADREGRNVLGTVAACAAKVDNSRVTLVSAGQDLVGRPLNKEGRAIDLRCACGSLLAKITRLGIEIKCRKCKRIQVIPYPQFPEETGTRGKNVKD